MLKGAQKRMYVVKMSEDSLFEEAYFVLRRERCEVQRKDMVSEAARIIRQSTGQEQAAKPKAKLPWQLFVGIAAGALAGSGITLALCLIL